MNRIALALFSLIAVSLPASAQTLPDGDGRYQLQRTDDGYFRVDRQSGKASHCREVGGQWQCNIVPDDADAYAEEIARLNERIETLEKERDQLADKDGTKPDSTTPKSESKDKVDKAMDTFEQMIRRFMGIVEDLKKDIEKGTSS